MNKEYIIGNEGYNLKFKRETLLNYGMNRWGLNKSSIVGPTSELIRECAPSKYEDWEEFYYSNAKQKKKNGIPITKEYLRYIGETLYVKLTEVVQKELEQISLDECIDYTYNLVLNRTYEGYLTEIETVYGQLESAIGYKIEPASDEWDRKYCVDFYIKIGDKYIGIQIKPISSGISLNHYQWIEMHRQKHEKFEKDYGGKVFFVFSTKNSNGKKVIFNIEVLNDIINEIKRLSNN